MEVKKSFKQTRVGVIPSNWEEVRLGEVFEITSSKRVFQSEWKNEGIPFYRARELAILSEKGYVTNELFISKEMYETYKKVYGVPQIGDILVTGVGTLGKVYTITDEKEFYFKDGNIIWFKNSGKICSGFLRQLYSTKVIIKQIEDASAGTTVGTYTISGAKKTVIPFPPLFEQNAIAETLSEVDALINALDALITKKRAIKQGVMQELLTGKRRLPGFSGEWKTKILEDIADIYSGGTPSTFNPDYWEGDIPWCTPTDITSLNGKKYLSETRKMVTEKGLINSSAKLIPSKSIVMTSRATIGECAINIIPMTTNQGFKNLIPKKSITVEFLYYLLCTMKQELTNLSTGSTFLEISKEKLRSIHIYMPTLKSEQEAIANILIDIDAELYALEEKLSKARMIKQGMMQELLTGRIRLMGG